MGDFIDFERVDADLDQAVVDLTKPILIIANEICRTKGSHWTEPADLRQIIVIKAQRALRKQAREGRGFFAFDTNDSLEKVILRLCTTIGRRQTIDDIRKVQKRRRHAEATIRRAMSGSTTMPEPIDDTVVGGVEARLIFKDIEAALTGNPLTFFRWVLHLGYIDVALIAENMGVSPATAGRYRAEVERIARQIGEYQPSPPSRRQPVRRLAKRWVDEQEPATPPVGDSGDFRQRASAPAAPKSP